MSNLFSHRDKLGWRRGVPLADHKRQQQPETWPGKLVLPCLPYKPPTDRLRMKVLMLCVSSVSITLLDHQCEWVKLLQWVYLDTQKTFKGSCNKQEFNDIQSLQSTLSVHWTTNVSRVYLQDTPPSHHLPPGETS